VITTDSLEVIDLASQYGFDTVLTSTAHNSGTDRINVAANILNLSEDEIIVNVQSDEPFIVSDVVQAVINRVIQIKNS
ncbi:cytidylyltransferase domain-containing protein, partial [Aliarcobacter butzleri]